MNISEILKRLPSGTRLYSVLHGSDVELVKVEEGASKPIYIKGHSTSISIESFYPDGSFWKGGECVLFPSRDKREWVKTILGLKPFDRVLAKETKDDVWVIEFFSSYTGNDERPYLCLLGTYEYCIPFEGNEMYIGRKENPE